MQNAFKVKDPDFELSPFTGMTKQHYIDLAKYMLERAFTHIDSIETPAEFSNYSGKKPTLSPMRPTGATVRQSLKRWKEPLPWRGRLFMLIRKRPSTEST